MARHANEEAVATVDGHRVLYLAPMTAENAARSPKETRALLKLLEKTCELVESSHGQPASE